MPNPSNDELDAKVLALITTKEATCARHIEAAVCSPDIGCRDIDRSLQRLRRKGAIKYISPVQGWRVVETDAPVSPSQQDSQPSVHACARPWFGVWAMQVGYAGHWHGVHDGSGADLQTTRTEAERVCKALNEFARERTDALGWSYEVRPYVSPKGPQ